MHHTCNPIHDKVVCIIIIQIIINWIEGMIVIFDDTTTNIETTPFLYLSHTQKKNWRRKWPPPLTWDFDFPRFFSLDFKTYEIRLFEILYIFETTQHNRERTTSVYLTQKVLLINTPIRGFNFPCQSF